MTETTYEIIKGTEFDNGIRVETLTDVIMKNARLVHAPDIRRPREKVGSTDFGTVTHCIPGACIRVACGCEGVRGHSRELAAMGKTEEFHSALIYAAKILAATAWDFLADEEIRRQIKEEFEEKKNL